MPSFQSPVPMSGRPCAPAVRPLSIARTQCSNSVPSSRGHARLAVGLVLVGRERRRLEERHALVEHAGVAGRARRTRRRRTAARADRRSSAMRRPRPLGSCHQCCTSPSTNCRPAARSRCSRARSGRANRQRHHVLQLIAEAEGAARLVVAGARPEPAADVLIEQPAVHQHVERIVRRADLDRRRASRPRTRCTVRERGRRQRRRVRDARSAARAWSRSVPWPSRNTSRRRLARLQHDAHVQRGAGIEPRAELRPDSVAWRSAAGCESVAVAADERRGDRRWPNAAARSRARTRRGRANSSL